MDKNKKILIIGAGPAGLSALKGLNQLSPRDDYQITCIEKQPDWSGQWNYSWRSGTDRYGEHVHSSMYSQLWTNLPKQVFQFPDYSFQQHFGKPVPSYVPRQVFKGYFLKRFQREGLKKFIKFNCVARNVQFLSNIKKFQVRYTDMSINKDTIQKFDYVVVATGHYSYPNLPDFKGIQIFKGKIAHCHELREFKQFKDLNVLVIGGSYSAEDVTLQCYKYGARRITWGYRKMKMGYKMDQIPKNIQIIPGLSHFDQSAVYFQNGQKRQIDAILLCTGYIHHYPFMEESIRLVCPSPTVLWPPNLYLSVAWQKNPNLFYVGMGSYRLSQLIVDVQGYLIRDIVSGKHVIPNLSNRDSTDLQREQQMKNAKSGDDIMYSGINYVKQLIKLTGYPNYDIDKLVPMYNQSVKDREQNFITYRDVGTFQSIHTGQWSCLGNKTWLQMIDVEPKNPQSKQKLNEFFEF